MDLCLTYFDQNDVKELETGAQTSSTFLTAVVQEAPRPSLETLPTMGSKWHFMPTTIIPATWL